MRIFVLGATGHVGSQVVDVALARGHATTAFVRSPQKIARDERALQVVKGDPLDVEQLARALPGHDALVSALGLPAREALRPSHRMTEFAATTVAAMKRGQVQRLAIVSAAVLFPLTGLPSRFFRWLLRNHARDLAEMEAVVRATSFDWTIARPGRLVASPDERYVSAHDAFPAGPLTMSFRAVATFLVDSIEQQAHFKATVGLTGVRSSR